VSDHSLEITTGRYKNITRQQRLYSFCKEIEDEYHFFLQCKRNSQIRNSMFEKFKELNPDFLQSQQLQKLNYILNPKLELLSYVYDFIKQSLELRK
jgi:hypothetical protein